MGPIRVAAPKDVSRMNSRRVYRPRGREKHGVDRNSENLFLYHRGALRHLLGTLIKEQKWHHASGVLSVLLKIPDDGMKPTAARGRWSDALAAMSVMKGVDCVDSSDLRIRRMFRVLMLQQPSVKLRGKVQLELALYLIRAGDREAAYDELRPIVDGKSYREDPVANLCHGLNSYHLWHDKCVEEVSRQGIADTGRHFENEGLFAREGGGESSAPEADDQSTYLELTRTALRGLGNRFSDRNVRASRAETQLDWDPFKFEQSRAASVEMEGNNIWETSQRFIYEETNEQGVVQSGEHFWRTVTVPLSSAWDRRLFPIQIRQDFDQKHYEVPMNDGRIRDLHAAAVKHLKQALSTAPDMLPALLPLVQLLLAVHDIKGAVDEIDKFSAVAKKHFIPPSIKMALLESLDKKNPIPSTRPPSRVDS